MSDLSQNSRESDPHPAIDRDEDLSTLRGPHVVPSQEFYPNYTDPVAAFDSIRTRDELLHLNEMQWNGLRSLVRPSAKKFIPNASPNDIDDLAIRVWFSLVRSLDMSKANNNSIIPITTLIARQSAFRMSKERSIARRGMSLDELQLEDKSDDSDFEFDVQEQEIKKKQGDFALWALTLLDPESRKLIVWRLRERSYEEIGADLDITPGAAKMRAYRARQKLASKVQDLLRRSGLKSLESA